VVCAQLIFTVITLELWNKVRELERIIGSSKLAVSEERRGLAQKTFSEFAPKILTILHSYLMSTGTNRDLQNKVYDTNYLIACPSSMHADILME
jgi:hypothetical protein